MAIRYRPQEIGQAKPAKSAVVTFISSKVDIDGVLDEPVWSASPPIGELTQRDPQPGGTASERTEVTLLHDADTLYIGVMSYDSEPQRIVGTLMARDAALANNDDWIEILLDPYHDRRNGFYFATNPNGALVDGLITANGSPDNTWDAIWKCAHSAQRSWLERGVRHSVQEPELPCRTDQVGI
jgi:hypothetical protein